MGSGNKSKILLLDNVFSFFFHEVGQSHEANWNPGQFSREVVGGRLNLSHRPYLEVLPLKLFLDMVPSPRALR